MYQPSDIQYTRFSPAGAGIIAWIGAFIAIIALAQFIAAGAYDKDLIGGILNVKFMGVKGTSIMFGTVVILFLGVALATGRGLGLLVLIGIVWIAIHFYGKAYTIGNENKEVFTVKSLPSTSLWDKAVKKASEASAKAIVPTAPFAKALSEAKAREKTTTYQSVDYFKVAKDLNLTKGNPLASDQKKWCKTHINDNSTSRLNCSTGYIWHEAN